MSKKNEDHLEQFFRKAVKQSDSSFMERDWKAMEKKLDEHPGTGLLSRARAVNRRVIVVSTGVILLAAYFLSFRPDRALVGGRGTADQEQAAARVEVPGQIDVRKEDSAADLLTVSPAHGEGITTSQDRALKPASDSPQETIAPGGSDDADRPLPPAHGKTGRQVSLAGGPTSAQLVADASIENVNGGRNTVPSRVAQDEKEQPKVPDSRVAAAAPEHPPTENDIREELNMPSKWSVTLAVAPDFSSTSLSRYTPPGTAFGLLFGYQIHDRIYANAGVLRSRKRYTGEGAEYQPPYGYWKNRTNGIVPDEISGNCEIVEIPVILRYDLARGLKSRIYAAGGLSTYFMLHEAYAYHFGEPNPGAADGWSSQSGSSYPLAIGHISFGYERQLSSGISLGIEPFLKVPFGGIGWSDIQLFTTGAYINLRYKIIKKSHREIIEKQ